MVEYITNNFPQLLTASTVGFLLGKLAIPHWLAKIRNKENFNRTVEHDSKERNKIALSLLGELSNGILKCWEECAINVVKSFTKTAPIGVLPQLKFDRYDELKSELIKYNIFTPSMWHNLDHISERIVELNRLMLEQQPNKVHTQLYWFAEACETYWTVVAEAYINNGGVIKDLTKPMPVKYKLAIEKS